jgi:hypothetical protein
LVETISFFVSSVLNAIPAVAGAVNSNYIANDVTINFADGSASTPSITNNGDTNTGIFFPAADTIAFAEGGAESMRLNSAGNLGLGLVPTGASGFSANKLLEIGGASGPAVIFRPSGSTAEHTVCGAGDGLVLGATGAATASNNAIRFFTSNTNSSTTPTERMRIDSDGNVTMTSGGNTTLTLTSTTGAWSSILKVGGAGGGNGQIHSTTALICFAGNQTTNGVVLNSNATSWASTSDERLKTNLKLIENAAEKVSTLRAFTGRFKTDEENVSRSFLIAQDVQAVLPEAVVAQQDEIGTLSLAYTDTIPLLVAAIQEQQAIITDLKSRIEALENK